MVQLTGIVYTHFSGKAHGQVGMGRVVISGCLDGVIVSTLAWNARYMCLIPALGAIFPIVINPHDTDDMYKAMLYAC